MRPNRAPTTSTGVFEKKLKMRDGRRAPTPFVAHLGEVLLVAQQIARAGAEHDADALRVRAAAVEAGVLERFGGRQHRDLIASRPAPLLQRRELARRLEVGISAARRLR